MVKEEGRTPEGAEDFRFPDQEKKEQERSSEKEAPSQEQPVENVYSYTDRFSGETIVWEKDPLKVSSKEHEFKFFRYDDSGKPSTEIRKIYFEAGIDHIRDQISILEHDKDQAYSQQALALKNEYIGLEEELYEAAAAARNNLQDESLLNKFREVVEKIKAFKTEKLDKAMADWPSRSKASREVVRGWQERGSEEQERGGDKDDMRRRFTIHRGPRGKSAFRGFGGSGRGAGGGAGGKW